jgi:hypothetical protein
MGLSYAETFPVRTTGKKVPTIEKSFTGVLNFFTFVLILRFFS